jgi:hypothetical protein
MNLAVLSVEPGVPMPKAKHGTSRNAENGVVLVLFFARGDQPPMPRDPA